MFSLKHFFFVLILTFTQNGMNNGQRDLSNIQTSSGSMSTMLSLGNGGGWGDDMSSRYPPYSSTGGSGTSRGTSNQGRVINNSILDDDDDNDIITSDQVRPINPLIQEEGMMPLNYKPRQQTQPQPQSNGFIPSRPMIMTNGAGNKNRYNGFESPMPPMSSRSPPPPMSPMTQISPMMSLMPKERETANNNRNTQTQPSLMTGMGRDQMITPAVPNLQETQVDDQPKIHRFVSVHVPPPEPIIPTMQRPSSKTTAKPEIHYQIVFIKAPTPSPQELQEIQLPPPPETKTLVYVLLKKPQMSELVRIQKEKARKPNKPEVFFIRYKDKQQQTQSQSANNGNNNNATPDNFNSGRSTDSANELMQMRNAERQNNANGNTNNNSNVVYGRPQSGNRNGMDIMTMTNNNNNMMRNPVGPSNSMDLMDPNLSSLESDIADSDFSSQNSNYDEKRVSSLSSYKSQSQRQSNERYNSGGLLYGQVGSQYDIVG